MDTDQITDTQLLPAATGNPDAVRVAQVVGDPEIAWTRHVITGDEALTTVMSSTNDDRDYGYPTESNSWTQQYQPREGKTALAQAIASTGRSRFSPGGPVLVILDNQPI